MLREIEETRGNPKGNERKGNGRKPQRQLYNGRAVSSRSGLQAFSPLALTKYKYQYKLKRQITYTNTTKVWDLTAMTTLRKCLGKSRKREGNPKGNDRKCLEEREETQEETRGNPRGNDIMDTLFLPGAKMQIESLTTLKQRRCGIP